MCSLRSEESYKFNLLRGVVEAGIVRHRLYYIGRNAIIADSEARQNMAESIQEIKRISERNDGHRNRWCERSWRV
jgi:hypothetical protein